MSRHLASFPFALDPLADLARAARSFEAAFHPKAGFPAYDVVQHGEDAIELRFAVAGYAGDELDVSLDGSELTVSGSKAETDEPEAAVQYLHRGIAQRSFERRFQLAEHVKVESAALSNGILSVRVRIARPQATARKIEIAAAA